MARVDAVIVGAGATGGIVAKELATAGWNVVLLGRGPWLKSFGHLETRDAWATGVDRVPFGPAAAEVRTVRATDRDRTRVVKPRDGLYGTLPAVVGGGSVYYGAMAWRFRPETFRLRSLLGIVEGANLADWPITYDDLEPYYEKAEYELGVSGDTNPYEAPRQRPLPLPPVPDNREAAVLYPAARRLGWKPFHTPLAILSKPYRGRQACVRCPYCNGFGCEVGAKSSTLFNVIPEAIRTGRCRLIPDSFALQITVDGRGNPNGVLYEAAGSKPWTRLEARVIVVCASATETPRLLLNSRSRFFPTGIGNERDQVGRNIENDGSLFAYGLFDDVVTDQLTAEALKFLADLRDHNDRDWFAPRKPFYESALKAPMEALAYEVAAACQRKGLPLFVKDRSPVTRIYRDIRFSPDKRPFHHHVGAALRGRAGTTQFGELYIHLSPEEKFVGAGFYMPEPAFLRLARTRIAERPEEFEAVVYALRKKGLELVMEPQLKRMPRGFDRFADNAVAGYLKLSSLLVSLKFAPREVEAPTLVGKVVVFAFAARPLLEFGWGLGYRPVARRESDLA